MNSFVLCELGSSSHWPIFCSSIVNRQWNGWCTLSMVCARSAPISPVAVRTCGGCGGLVGIHEQKIRVGDGRLKPCVEEWQQWISRIHCGRDDDWWWEKLRCRPAGAMSSFYRVGVMWGGESGSWSGSGDWMTHQFDSRLWRWSNRCQGNEVSGPTTVRSSSWESSGRAECEGRVVPVAGTREAVALNVWEGKTKTSKK
jgi:hypothetical protein